MADWQLTATTIYCDAVGGEVTVIVYKDRSVKCTGYSKYGEPGREKINLAKAKSKQLKRRIECEGLECYRVMQYKEKLFAENAKR